MNNFAKKKNDDNFVYQKIVDMKHVGVYILCIVCLLGFPILILIEGGVEAPVALCFGLFLFASPLVILNIWRIVLLSKGIIIDEKNDVILFPSGKINANGFGDIFSARYLFQYFMVKRISLSQIRSIKETYKISTANRIFSIFSNNNSGPKADLPAIELTGDFGSADISFGSSQKRDEVFALLCQINDMGIPVSNR